MSNIICRVCGEPWDMYGLKHGDVKPDEADKILDGKGCPCCKFGTDPKKHEDHAEEYLNSLLSNSEAVEISDSDLWLT